MACACFGFVTVCPLEDLRSPRLNSPITVSTLGRETGPVACAFRVRRFTGVSSVQSVDARLQQLVPPVPVPLDGDERQLLLPRSFSQFLWLFP
jgi:hypothetical protein